MEVKSTTTKDELKKMKNYNKKRKKGWGYWIGSNPEGSKEAFNNLNDVGNMTMSGESTAMAESMLNEDYDINIVLDKYAIDELGEEMNYSYNDSVPYYLLWYVVHDSEDAILDFIYENEYHDITLDVVSDALYSLLDDKSFVKTIEEATNIDYMELINKVENDEDLPVVENVITAVDNARLASAVKNLKETITKGLSINAKDFRCKIGNDKLLITITEQKLAEFRDLFSDDEDDSAKDIVIKAIANEYPIVYPDYGFLDNIDKDYLSKELIRYTKEY